jgi:hypothetical protein
MAPELLGSGLPADATDELVRLYTAAAQRVADMVLHPTGRSESSREFKQARASVLVHQLDQLVRELNQKTADWIGPNLRRAMLDGIKRADTQLKAISVLPPGSPLAGSLSMVDQRTAKIFARDIYADLSSAGDSMADNAKAVLRKTAQQNIGEAELDRILAGGVIEGTPAATIRALRDRLKAVAGEKITVIDKNGDPIEFDAGYYARMVVRTKTRQATVVARHERLAEEGIDLVSIVGLVSKNFCTAYLGQVFSLGGKSDKYPALSELPSGGPPFHPNCSKSTRPFVADLASEKQLDLADGIADADKFLGVDGTTAQRRFQDLQVYGQVKSRYATTARDLFGKAAA